MPSQKISAYSAVII